MTGEIVFDGRDVDGPDDDTQLTIGDWVLPVELANPWRDERGRFAPKGYIASPSGVTVPDVGAGRGFEPITADEGNAVTPALCRPKSSRSSPRSARNNSTSWPPTRQPIVGLDDNWDTIKDRSVRSGAGVVGWRHHRRSHRRVPPARRRQVCADGEGPRLRNGVDPGGCVTAEFDAAIDRGQGEVPADPRTPITTSVCSTTTTWAASTSTRSPWCRRCARFTRSGLRPGRSAAPTTSLTATATGPRMLTTRSTWNPDDFNDDYYGDGDGDVPAPPRTDGYTTKEAPWETMTRSRSSRARPNGNGRRSSSKAHLTPRRARTAATPPQEVARSRTSGATRSDGSHARATRLPGRRSPGRCRTGRRRRSPSPIHRRSPSSRSKGPRSGSATTSKAAPMFGCWPTT